MKRRVVLVALLVIQTASLGRARADCAAAPGYHSAISGNTVKIAVDFPYQSLTDADVSSIAPIPLLRQDTTTGKIVQLSVWLVMSCPIGGGLPCFVDECVPAGSYRYGLEKPFTCDEYSCGWDLQRFVPITVPTPVAAGCTWSPGNSMPTPYSAAPPWGGSNGDGGAPAEWVSCPATGCMACSTGGRSAVLTADGLAMLCALIGWSASARLRRRRSSRATKHGPN